MGLFSSFKQKQTSVGDAPPERAQSFRRADLRTHPAGGEWHAVQVSGQNTAAILPSFVVDFLVRCSDFQSFAEHLENYATYHDLEPEQTRELRDWLPRLQAGGMFISADELREKCESFGVANASPARISAIGFPTGGNPRRLRRALTSFLDNARKHEREPRFVIADNTPTKEGREACKQMLRALRREDGKVEILFAGDEEKRAFAKKLAACAECDPDIVDFALFDVFGYGFACGANRNALLLHETGNAFSSVDDDMICQIASAPDLKNDLAFFSQSDAFQRWFYETREEALRDAEFTSHDYLAMHESLLGKSLTDCITATTEQIRFGKIGDKFLRRLLAGNGRVVMTFAGHIGDPGIPTSFYYLGYKGENLARLTGGTESFYRAAHASRNVRSVMSARTIGDASLSPGMAMGLDVRELLPPFPPVLHAEDFVFGAAVWQCCAQGFAGHVPYALVHDPGTKKTVITPQNLDAKKRVTIWEFAHILRAFILDYEPAAGELSTARRMQGLGRHLREIASAPFPEFVDRLRARALQHESDKIEYLEHHLSEGADASDFWRADVEHYIEATREALQCEGFEIPYDLKNDRADYDEARRLMQRLILEYGRLLEVWPRLFETAPELRTRGCALAREI